MPLPRHRPARSRRALRALPPLLAALALAQTASAADKTWAGNGDWLDADGWSPQGVPAAGDSAFLGNSGAEPQELTFGTTASLNVLAFYPQDIFTLVQTGGDLSSAYQIMDPSSGVALHYHAGGNNSISGVLSIGAPNSPNAHEFFAAYQLGAGQDPIEPPRLYAAIINLNDGGALVLNDSFSGHSPYLEFATMNQFGGLMNMGRTRTMRGGTVNQSGGKSVGHFVLEAGEYNLSGGTFEAAAPLVGSPPTMTIQSSTNPSTFTHSGGTLTTEVLTLSSPLASYVLKGTGALHAQSFNVTDRGGVRQDGGTATIGDLTLSSGAAYQITAGNLTLQANLPSTTGVLRVAGGAFVQAGGSVSTSLLNVRNAAVYELADGTLGISGSAQLQDGATFNQFGGTLSATQVSIDAATYSLHGGSLDGRIFLNAGGVFEQTGGTLTASQGFVHRGGTVKGALNNKSRYEYQSGSFDGRLVNEGDVVLLAPLVLLNGLDNRVPFTIPDGDQLVLHGDPSANASTINLGGTSSVLAGSGQIENAAGALITGRGTIHNPIANFGTVNPRSGDLILTGPLENNGMLSNAVGANLFVQSPTVKNAGDIIARAAGAIVFDAPLTNPSRHTITLLGGTLAAPTITNNRRALITGTGDLVGDLINSGDITFNGPTRLFGSLTNNGEATITVRNDQTLVTGRAVNEGKIMTENGTIIFDGGLEGAGATTVAAGGTLLADHVQQSTLTLDGTPQAPTSVTIRRAGAGGGTTVMDTLSIAGSDDAWFGQLDLADNDMILRADAATRDAVLATVESQLTAARNDPAGRWRGNGITSSAAADNLFTTLAAILNPGLATFSGEVIDENAILIKYTYNGDANVDGRINADDYFRIDSGFLAQPPDPGYRDGDFNYDNTINADDYFLIDSAFLAQGAPLTSPSGALSSSISLPIPEPLFSPFLFLPLLLAARRTRSRHRLLNARKWL